MQPSQFMLTTVNKEDEAEYIFLITHTYEWDKDALNAIQNHVTKWLLTAAGRRFMRKQPVYQSDFPWSDLLTDTPEVVAAAPGILKVEYMPYMIFALGQDDHPEPWSVDRNPTTDKRIFALDKDTIRDLLAEENQHAEQHG